MKAKLVTAFMAFILCFSFIAVNTSHADELTGITLEKEMRAMIEKGIIKGFGENDYRPKGQVTREQFAGFLSRTLELPKASSTFKDVNPSSALAADIGAIQEAGLMTGTLDQRFMPTKTITREEMALTMSRALVYKGLTVQQKPNTFQDAKQFTLKGGLDAAQTLASSGIMSGGTTSQGAVFNPKAISTRDQVAAVLYRYLAFESGTTQPEQPGQPGQPENPEQPEKPEAPKYPFQVGTIKDGKVVYNTTTYQTYGEAEKAYGGSAANKVLAKNNKVLKMKNGRIYSAANPKNYTSIYSDTGLKKEVTYVQHGREMKYVGSGPDYAIVQTGGMTGYVKHSEVDLVPTELVKGNDYYQNVNGLLTHYTYNYLTNTYASYTNGPSPSFMKPNTKYYSFDDVNYYNAQNQLVGTHYSYFQFLSARSQTVYTAAELNRFIGEALQQRESLGYAKYKDATKKSKLINLGEHFKKLEKEYHVNAMFILAVAIHESDYGMSARAQSCNNLFGIAAFDSNLELCQRSFDTPQDSAVALAKEYMNRNYLNPLGGYANGAVPGNKGVGVNVKYASDPDWGSKVAGHLWTMDNALGKKEYNSKQLARVVVNTSVNVRTSPNGNLLFTYKAKDLGLNNAFGYPLVIVDEQKGNDGYIWYQIIADINPNAPTMPSSTLGWIRSDLVKKIN